MVVRLQCRSVGLAKASKAINLVEWPTKLATSAARQTTPRRIDCHFAPGKTGGKGAGKGKGKGDGRGKGKTDFKGKETRSCHFCQKVGHLEKDCRAKKAQVGMLQAEPGVVAVVCVEGSHTVAAIGSKISTLW